MIVFDEGKKLEHRVTPYQIEIVVVIIFSNYSDFVHSYLLHHYCH